MTSVSHTHPLVYTFGILGNLVSFMVFIAPVPTFYRIVKKKSSEGFHSLPYVVGLFSAMLWIYYAMVKTNVTLLITINSFGCIAETIYMKTLGLVLLLNFGVFGLILFLTQILCQGTKRAEVIGWICMAFSISVFVAPLSIMGRVIRTKSVEFMPFNLSLALTVSAVMWFLYGLLLKDVYVAVPNIPGMILGVLQMILYGIYRNSKPTFNKIYKKKSTEGYQSIPYVIALFSCMLWIYYAFLKTNTTLLITINSFGMLIETIYVSLFLYYAPKKARVNTVKMLLLTVVGGFGAIILVTQFLFKGVVRGQIVGWICLIFSLCVFVAPLGIVRQVIKTKSVEYMPILLSVFLTISAVMWFFYGLLLKDAPNILGFIFGILQMILYAMYRKKHKPIVNVNVEVQNPVIILDDNKKIPELTEEQIIDIVKLGKLFHKFNIPGQRFTQFIRRKQLKTNTTLLITINTFGVFVETIYVVFYLIYAPKKSRVQTIKMLSLFVVGGFGAIILVTQFLFKGVIRGQRKVIKTKSVEYMPLLLSVFLTLSAVMWFFYGLLLKDINIAAPNILGFIFGVLQMILYVIYSKKEKAILKEQKLPEIQKGEVIVKDENMNADKKFPELTQEQIIDIVRLGLMVCKGKVHVATCPHGNIVSFIVFLSPIPTFYNIYKKKSTEGYQSIPYVVALFSSMLWIYYALLKSNMPLLITINSFGMFIETIYVVVGGFGAIVLITEFLFKGVVRGQIVGWICLIFSLCVFVAPLGIVRKVIKTKSVEYMPLLLSVFLTLSAVMWFFYGLLLKDINIAAPNVLGFIFGILQIVLYAIYSKKEKVILKEQKLPEIQTPAVIVKNENMMNTTKKLPELTQEQIIDIVKLGLLVCSDKTQVATCPNDTNCGVKDTNNNMD
uniref:Sugar transporter SWEET1 n=1 Tax=Solanum lycopersicum TaxID=4081 RepID=A0A3Q7GCS8_SOLLC